MPRFRAIERVARRKLLYLHQAQRLDELKVPPGNRLEALKGDRKGQHRIRINDQWRICLADRTEARTARQERRVRGLRWKDGDVFDVEIVDYR